MYIKTISDFRAAMRNGPYAWPGGYPMYFVMGDGEALSFDAAKSERRLILEALRDGKSYGLDWYPIAFEIHWEGEPLICSHTGVEIESAYGSTD